MRVGKFIDLTGQRFGRLTVLEPIRIQGKTRKYLKWKCICECGKHTNVSRETLIKGETKSCGCLSKEIRQKQLTVHGGRNTRLYRIWGSMKARCYNAKHKSYYRYGGRGIAVCDEWREDFVAFREWALANGYTEEMTIDRIDNDGNYCQGNCQWLTKAENNRKMHADRKKKSE